MTENVNAERCFQKVSHARALWQMGILVDKLRDFIWVVQKVRHEGAVWPIVEAIHVTQKVRHAIAGPSMQGCPASHLSDDLDNARHSES